MAIQIPTQQSTASQSSPSASLPSASPSKPEEPTSLLSRGRARINSLNLSRPVAIGLCTMLLLGMGASYYLSRPAPVTGTVSMGLQADTPDIVWLRTKIRETRGDLSRLSADERKRADQITEPLIGMGADAVFTNPNALAPLDPNKFQESRTAAWRAAQGR